MKKEQKRESNIKEKLRLYLEFHRTEMPESTYNWLWGTIQYID